MQNQNLEGLYPLTESQLNIWFDQLLDPESTSYNIGFYIEFSGAIDIQRLGKALQTAINSLDTMRAEIVVIGDQPYQRFLHQPPIPLPFWDFTQFANPVKKAHAVIDHDIQQPYDLENGVNARFGLIKTGEDKWIWFGTCHHIILDGVGGAILFNRFAQAYKDECLPAEYFNSDWPTAIYRDLAYLESESFTKDESYWNDCLEGCEDPTPIAHKTIGAVNHFPFPKTIIQTVPRTDLNELQELSKRIGIGIYSILSSVIFIYLSKRLNNLDICIGMPSSGRSKITRNVPGVLSNTNPLRMHLHPSMTVEDILRRISSKVRKAFRHSQYPLRLINRNRRKNGLSQPFNMILNYENFIYDLNFVTATGKVHSLNSGPVPELSLMFCEWQENDPIELRLDYNPDVLSSDDAAAHLAAITRLLNEIPRILSKPLADISIVDPGVYQQLISSAQADLPPSEFNLSL